MADLETRTAKPKDDGAEAEKSDPDFMMSFARGLAVIQCFAEQEKPLSIAHASKLTGLSRASVRRCLHTLRCFGLAEQQGQNYALLPGVLRLGYAYLSSNPLASAPHPLPEQIPTQPGPACSPGNHGRETDKENAGTD